MDRRCSLNEDFIKTIMKKVIKDVFSKLMFSTLKNYMHFILIYHDSIERMKIEKIEKLAANLDDKTQHVI